MHGIASALGHLADAARRDEDYQSARTLYEESLATFMESGSKWHIANELDLGELARERGDCIRAQSLYPGEHGDIRELGDIRSLARLFEGFMALAIGENRLERALRLAGSADAVRKKYGVPLPPNQETELKASLQSIKRSYLNQRKRLHGTAEHRCR